MQNDDCTYQFLSCKSRWRGKSFFKRLAAGAYFILARLSLIFYALFGFRSSSQLDTVNTPLPSIEKVIDLQHWIRELVHMLRSR
jgi:hypothetical protein